MDMHYNIWSLLVLKFLFYELAYCTQVVCVCVCVEGGEEILKDEFHEPPPPPPTSILLFYTASLLP